MGLYTCLVILGCLAYANAQLGSHCAAMLCAQATCPDPYTPPGQCCPVCPGGRTCFYKGVMRREGESFRDECNTCRCMNGRVSCTRMACPGKPGRCPRIGRPMIGLCFDECTSDFGCPGRQKCCSNGCGKSCRTPRGGDKDCNRVRCRAAPCANPITIPGRCCLVCPTRRYD